MIYANWARRVLLGAYLVVISPLVLGVASPYLALLPWRYLDYAFTEAGIEISDPTGMIVLCALGGVLGVLAVCVHIIIYTRVVGSKRRLAVSVLATVGLAACIGVVIVALRQDFYFSPPVWLLAWGSAAPVVTGLINLLLARFTTSKPGRKTAEPVENIL